MFGVCLSVAGFCCRIESKEKKIITGISKRYQEFVSGKQPSFIISISTREKKITEPLGFKLDGKQSVLISYHSKRTMDLKKGKAKAWFYPVKNPSDLIQINSILGWFFALFLLEKKALVIHSSAVEKNGEGFVFVGDSRQGKSTLAKLLKETSLITDDASVLRIEKGKPMVYSIPFLNKPRTPQKGTQIKKIFFINKANKTRIEKTSPVESTAELFMRDYFLIGLGKKSRKKSLLNGNSYQKLLGKALNISGDISRRTQCYRLHFTKSPAMWEKIK